MAEGRGEELATLRWSGAGGVARVVFSRPPLNLFDPATEADLERAFAAIEDDPELRVAVFESDVPGYFLAHYDVAAILAEEAGPPRTRPGGFNRLIARIRGSRVVTIGKVAGAARGGGAELLLALDMRFAADGARFGFPEAALGILAAGGGTQRLPLTVGRARALELLLGCGDLDAAAAERYGFVNRRLAAAELDPWVEGLAAAIAARPPRSVAAVKLAATVAAPEPAPPGFALEALLLDVLKADSESRRLLESFLALGGQTVAGEDDFAALIEALGR